jgi:hypothetical protein
MRHLDIIECMRAALTDWHDVIHARPPFLVTASSPINDKAADLTIKPVSSSQIFDIYFFSLFDSQASDFALMTTSPKFRTFDLFCPAKMAHL